MIETLIRKLQKDRFLTLEVAPHASPTLAPLIHSIQSAGLEKRVDGFVCTDSPLAKLRHSSILATIKLQQSLQKPVICTLSMRDRNSLALQGELMGANEFDVRAILALTGDAIRLGDQPQAKGVFEGKSTLLLEIIRSFNRGIDLQGQPLKSPLRPLYPLAVINSYSQSPESLKKRLRQKIEAGAIGIVTQPIYDLEVAKTLLGWVHEINQELGTSSELVLGYFPVVSYRTAHFLYSKLPGVYIPNEWLSQLEAASKINTEEERRVGLELSRNIWLGLWNFHPKIHFMSANNTKLASEILPPPPT
ncbi:MAG: methylenetetrahydrofolate reductase [Wolinella sp.]